MIKRFIIFFACLISLALTVSAQQKSTDDSVALFRIANDGKWGYIDRTGKVAIQLQFEEAGSFSNGLAYVGFSEESGLKGSGYIDNTGKCIWPLTK